MSGLLFLTSEEFYLAQGPKGSLLCHEIKNGFSLVLFYSTKCKFCGPLIDIFKLLPTVINGCYFAMINISNRDSRQVVNMSKNTVSPIEYVPYIILYINGKPFMRYDGPSTIEDIRNFVFEVARKVKTKQKFTEEDKRIKQHDKKIPEYTTGIPICGNGRDDVCYLLEDEAYRK